MTLEEYVDQIKFQVTGDVLCSDISDDSYARAVNLALRELRRFYDMTALVQAPPNQCISLSDVEQQNNIKINRIVSIYRTKAAGTGANAGSRDPLAIMAWNCLNNYHNSRYSNMVYNYMAVNTIQQISNTLSTDLDFKQDFAGRKLYVNYNSSADGDIVLEYVPTIEKPEDVIGDYWTEVLLNLSLAHTKIIIGRIRSRFTQDNALWKQDGDKMLEEGTNELNAIMERLKTHANIILPLD